MATTIVTGDYKYNANDRIITLTGEGGWVPRDYQRPAWNALKQGKKRVMMIDHRRSGKDDLALRWTARSAMLKKGNYWHMLPEGEQCRKAIWNAVNPHTGIRRIDESFPPEIRTVTRENEMFIKLMNGSTWQALGSDNYESFIGSTPIGVIFSEWAQSNPASWAYLSPIFFENGGWAIFNGTPRGQNHCHQMYLAAQADPDWFAQSLTADDTGIFDPAGLEKERLSYIAQHGEDVGQALFLQEYYCFPAGTKIWTSVGQKPIEQIALNDIVLTHAGRWRKVQKLYGHIHEGEIIEISSYGISAPLVCTPNHPVRVCDPSTQSYKWVPAQEIAAGNYVALPRMKRPASSIIDSDMALMLAWFITEGSVAKNLVQFTLSAKEDKEAAELKSIIKRFGKTVIYKNEPTQNVVVNSCWLADFLISSCGTGASNKRIPWHLIGGHEHIVYEAMIVGDGCRGVYRNRPTDVYSTISYGLALDMQMLAHMLGKRAKINRQPKESKSQTIMGRHCNISDSYSVTIHSAEKRKFGKQRIIPLKHAVAAEVRDVKRKPFAGPVYNFSVQYDESYVAEGRIVHNCSFTAAIMGAYYAKEMQQVEKDQRITFVPHDPAYPVDTAWDMGLDQNMAVVCIQEIGLQRRFIDCETGSGGLPDTIVNLQKRPYKWRKHYMPHDAEPKQIGSGKSMKETAQSLGFNDIHIVPQGRVADGINQVRLLLPQCVFDKTKCAPLTKALIHYQREYDEKKSTFRSTPRHDQHSHFADAVRTYAMGYVPDTGGGFDYRKHFGK